MGGAERRPRARSPADLLVVDVGAGMRRRQLRWRSWQLAEDAWGVSAFLLAEARVALKTVDELMAKLMGSSVSDRQLWRQNGPVSLIGPQGR